MDAWPNAVEAVITTTASKVKYFDDIVFPLFAAAISCGRNHGILYRL
jgi:hypothetical protein